MSDENVKKRLNDIDKLLKMAPDDYIKYYKEKFNAEVEKSCVYASMVGMASYLVTMLVDDME